MQNARLVAEANARLDHVCGLVAQARWPLCPLNGAVLAVPAVVSDRDDGAQQWGLVAREDLARAEAAFRLRFPVYTLVGGVEMLPGGFTFFERFAAEKGAQRLGKSFPLNPDLQPAAVGQEVEKAARWVFGSLLPYHVFKQTRTDAPADSRENASLVRFLIELRRRAPRLARLVGRAVGIGARGPRVRRLLPRGLVAGRGRGREVRARSSSRRWRARRATSRGRTRPTPRTRAIAR